MKRNRRSFVPAVQGLEFRALLTTFEPIIPDSIKTGPIVIGDPGPLPVPPLPPELNKPLKPYDSTPIPDAPWLTA